MGAFTELQVRDRIMAAFIREDPLDIVLHRPVSSDTAAGGRKETGTDSLEAQTFTVYPFKRRLTQEYVHNPQTYGEERVEKIIWIIIFNRDQDIQVDDWFDPSIDVIPVTDRLTPGRYEVVFISARLWDRGQAGLMYRG